MAEEPAWQSPEPLKRNDYAEKDRRNPADIIMQQEYFAREYAVAVEEVKIMQVTHARRPAHVPERGRVLPYTASLPPRRNCASARSSRA
jgi:hypothetical protein